MGSWGREFFPTLPHNSEHSTGLGLGLEGCKDESRGGRGGACHLFPLRGRLFLPPLFGVSRAHVCVCVVQARCLGRATPNNHSNHNQE
jgi:hypothetical protein